MSCEELQKNLKAPDSKVSTVLIKEKNPLLSKLSP